MRIFTLCFLLFSTLWLSPAFAKELAPSTVKRVLAAQQLVETGDVAHAIETLNDLNTKADYDTAYVKRYLAILNYQAGNSDQAIMLLRDAVTLNALPTQDQWQSQRMLADLLLNGQEYQQALEIYRSILTTDLDAQKTKDIHYRIIQCFYKLQQWQSALSQIHSFASLGYTKSVNVLTIQLVSELQLERFKPALSTTDTLLRIQPTKKNWWMQKVSLQIKLNQLKSALSTLQLAELNKIGLVEQERRLLVQLYMNNQLPERAARELAKLQDRTDVEEKRLAQLWQQAKVWDKAEAVWSEISKTDKRYAFQLAQVQAMQGKFESVIASLDRLPEANFDEDAASLKIQALYKLDKIEQASKTAHEFIAEENSKKISDWLTYLNQIQQYRAALSS